MSDKHTDRTIVYQYCHCTVWAIEYGKPTKPCGKCGWGMNPSIHWDRDEAVKAYRKKDS